MNDGRGKNESAKNDDNKRFIVEDIPTSTVDDDKFESLIAGALQQMSINELENVYHEMHGVNDVVQEKPEMLQRSMVALHTELETIKHSHREGLAFNMAEAMSRDYVCDPGFRIKFLRSERFDVKKSAEKMIQFFDCKMQLFGQEKLCTDIALGDLDSDDTAFLKSGYLQLLPTRDRSGRVTLMLFFFKRTHKCAENVARVLYYLLMTAVEDEETQQRGVTSVNYSAGKFDKKSIDLGALHIGAWFLKSLPIRMCSVHGCFNDPAFRFVVSSAVYLLPDAGRARTKLHCGTQMEIFYELMTFGIAIDSIPLSTEGKLKRKTHLDFLKMRQRQEQMVGAAPRIVFPTHRDVLFGRGKPFREFRGNVRLYEMIDAKLEHYESIPIKQKTEAIVEMVDAVKATGGRFLKQDDAGCWMVVDGKMAKEKVSNTFRTRLRIASSEIGERNTSESKVVVSDGNKRLKKQDS